MNTCQNQPCFCVIMPIGHDTQAEQKKEIIREVAKKHGFVARFPEFKRESGSFDLWAILQDFKQASFILADLSFERPSCYYELGLVEALGMKAYLFALEDTDIHQTSNRDRVQFYKNLEHLRTLVDKTLEQA